MRAPQAHIESATVSTVITDEGPFFTPREGSQEGDVAREVSEQEQAEPEASGTEAEPLELTVADDAFIRDLEERSSRLPDEESLEGPPAEGVRRSSRVPEDLQVLRDQQDSQQEQPPIAEIETGRMDDMAQSFGGRTPVEMGQAAGEFNRALNTAQQNEIDAINEELPEMDQPTGLEPGQGRISIAPPEPRSVQPESIENREEEPVSTQIEPTPEPAPARARTSIRNPRNESELEQAMASLRVDTQVETSMGPRPQINLSGQADPEQADRQQAENTRSLLGTQNEEINVFRRDFGENDIYPNIPTETLETRDVNASSDMPSLEVESQFPVMLESDVELVNEDILTELGEERERALTDSRQATEEFDRGRSTHIEQSLEEVRREERTAAEDQIRARESNAQTIQGLREEHEQESQTIVEDYNAEVRTERQTHDSDLSAEIDGVGQNVESFFDEAEGEASEQQRAAEADVARRRREAEEAERNRSWLDAAVDAVTDFFNDLIEAVTNIIDDLRASIKQLFDAVKARVSRLIDAARNLVIRMIRTFGNLLIRLSNIALARFPGLRDRINRRIQNAMDRAEQLVNEIADRLKAAVIAILDALATAIDGLLAAFNAVLVVALEVLKQFTLAVVRMAHAFYEYILNSILQLATLVAFCGLMTVTNIFLSTAWHFLGRSTKERLVDILLSTMIWLFENAPDEFDQGFLWPIFVNMQLGYFREIYGWEMETKIAFYDKIANMMLSLSFWGNFLLGIFVGIWDNLWGIIEGIWMLIRFIFYDMWVLMGRLYDMLVDLAPEVVDLIRGLNEDIHAFIEELKTTGKDQLDRLRKNLSRENIEQFFEGLGNDLRVRSMMLGGRLANQAREFIMRDDAYATIGMALGRATGYILVEVLLAVFTAGIGTAIKWGLKGVKVAVRFARILGSVGRAGGFFSRVIAFFNRGLKWLIRAIMKFAEKVASIARGLLQRFKTIFQNLSRRVDDIVARLTGRRPRTPRTPDGTPGRPRPGDGPDGQRPRPRHPHDSDMAEDELRWGAFVRSTAASLMGYRSRGIRRGDAQRILRQKISQNRRIAAGPALVIPIKGLYKLMAKKRGGIPPTRIPREVTTVPLLRARRWQLGRAAIITRLARIRTSEINEGGLRRILRMGDFEDDYAYSQLFPRWDQRESDWDIMGAMSGPAKVTEVSEFEEIFDDYQDEVQSRIRALLIQHSEFRGLVRSEIDEALEQIWNLNIPKYQKIFTSAQSIRIEEDGNRIYRIEARLKVTDNRNRRVMGRIPILPSGRTRTDPIPIDWYSGTYSPVRLRALEPDSDARWDLPRYPATHTTWNAQVGEHQAHSFTVTPFQRYSLKVPLRQKNWPASALFGRNNATIGILQRNRVWPNKVMRKRLASAPGVRGPAGISFRTLMRNYGNPMSNEHVDHVQDLAFSGPDAFHNLWPLSSNTNTGTARNIYNRYVDHRLNNERNTFYLQRYGIGLWFKIKRIIPM